MPSGPSRRPSPPSSRARGSRRRSFLPRRSTRSLAFGANGAAGERDGANGTLELAGEALAAGSDELRTAEQVTRLATEATGALGALLWRAAEDDAGLELLGSFGLKAVEREVARAGEAAGRALADRLPVT